MHQQALRLVVFVAWFAWVGPTAVASPVWVQQGPGPILNGQDEGITSAQGPNPVAGAIQAVAASPSDANTIYVATVNGGVWKTTSARNSIPTWTPLTDGQLPGLSFNSIAISPLDSNVIFAGAGQTSSYFDGGPRFGIGRSLDGGATWAVVGTTLAKKDIRSIVPTKTLVNNKQVVLAGTSTGVYRSVDGGVTYARVTSGIVTGLVTDLVADPGVSTRFYAAMNGKVYRSDTTGASWVLATGTGFHVVSTYRVLLSVHHDPSNDVVYAMVIQDTGYLYAVYRSTNQGTSWASLSKPKPEIFPGAQGDIHGAILADQTSPNIVWISGDRQNDPFPNVNGLNNYSANVFRNVSGTWQNMVGLGNGGGARSTSPHADSRAMVYDALGNILQSNDGGIFRLNFPTDNTRRWWSSLNSNLTPTEAHSAAYDPLSKIVISGNQDTGVSYQINGTLWSDALQGDGGDIMVDSDQTAHPGTSIRYMGYDGLPAFRVSYNSSNQQVYPGFVDLGLNITSGPGSGETIDAFDPYVQFYQPYVLNRIKPSRMLIGTQYIYESKDQGDNFANLGAAGGQVSDGLSGNTCMAYGGRLNGVAQPDVFYVAAGTRIKHRVTAGGPITTLTSYSGGSIRAITMDPQNYTHLFVLDTTGLVWGTFDEGATWLNLTSNLDTLSSDGAFGPDLRTIEVYSPDTLPAHTVLLVGGLGGVWQKTNPGATTTWAALAAGPLPNALVYDLRYDYTNNVLVAGTLGRGVWTVTNYFTGGAGSVPQLASAAGKPSTPNLTGTGASVVLPHPVNLPPHPPAAGRK